jgi:hypothetical protein
MARCRAEIGFLVHPARRAQDTLTSLGPAVDIAASKVLEHRTVSEDEVNRHQEKPRLGDLASGLIAALPKERTLPQGFHASSSLSAQ